MSELTHAEYNREDILAVNRWVDLREGTLYLLDPATGDPLSTDQPPLWLASDPRLMEGYQALGDPAHEHELTIAFSRHLLARDLGRFENRFSWFERTYARSHAAAFEEPGWDREGWNDVLQTLRSLGQLPPGLSSSKKFGDRLLRSSLKHTHVGEFSYDIEKTDIPIDKLILEVGSPEPSARLEEMSSPVRHCLKFAAHALREWYIPGKYMHEFLKLPLPDFPRVLLTLGGGHKDVVRKFNVLGFSPKVRRLFLPLEGTKTATLFAEAMRKGSIDFQALGGLALT